MMPPMGITVGLAATLMLKLCVGVAVTVGKEGMLVGSGVLVDVAVGGIGVRVCVLVGGTVVGVGVGAASARATVPLGSSIPRAAITRISSTATLQTLRHPLIARPFSFPEAALPPHVFPSI